METRQIKSLTNFIFFLRIKASVCKISEDVWMQLEIQVMLIIMHVYCTVVVVIVVVVLVVLLSWRFYRVHQVSSTIHVSLIEKHVRQSFQRRLHILVLVMWYCSSQLAQNLFKRVLQHIQGLLVDHIVLDIGDDLVCDFVQPVTNVGVHLHEIVSVVFQLFEKFVFNADEFT